MPIAEALDRAWLSKQTVLYAEGDELSFAAERLAVVITDIQMPRLDRLTMAEPIRSLDPSVRIVSSAS